jgi:hypothetical protein
MPRGPVQCRRRRWYALDTHITPLPPAPMQQTEGGRTCTHKDGLAWRQGGVRWSVGRHCSKVWVETAPSFPTSAGTARGWGESTLVDQAVEGRTGKVKARRSIRRVVVKRYDVVDVIGGRSAWRVQRRRVGGKVLSSRGYLHRTTSNAGQGCRAGINKKHNPPAKSCTPPHVLHR